MELIKVTVTDLYLLIRKEKLEYLFIETCVQNKPLFFCPSVFPYPVPPIEENVLDEGKLLKPWDTKKVK